MDRAERLAMTELCDGLADLRAECLHHPAEVRRLFARIEVEARARRPIVALLAELVGSDGSPAARGVAGGLPGFGAGRAHEERFGCPDGACDRDVRPLPAGPVPRCQVTGARMKRR
ncbi:hypothetical protein [Saccharothrix obliqua]|uniref:hypothetical protein n=1 Tax=Saccharothrix obliqua TaxID=2861747 RepID=UPI001C5EFB2E|nr:hypothetical protein [Saccharothrix obliqua]MBW4720395.1 hypothetical protein [Saccharothrix obliqua]